MIVLPQSIVSLGKAMYQSDILSLEFRLNSELVNSVAKHKFKTNRQTHVQLSCKFYIANKQRK